MSPEQAFSEIEAMLNPLISEHEWDIFLNHCQFILRLARIANTTEIPEVFASNLEVIQDRIASLELEKHNEIKELCVWFRIKI